MPHEVLCEGLDERCSGRRGGLCSVVDEAHIFESFHSF